MAIFERDILEGRRRRAAEAFGSRVPTVLIGAGEPIPKPGGLDQTYPFTAHPEYYWLTGSQRSGGVLAFNQQEGWTHFVRPVTPSERLWEGNPDAPEGEDVAELSDRLKRYSDSQIAMLGSPVHCVASDIGSDEELNGDMRVRLDAVRRRKDSAEIELLGRAVSATAAGHAKAREVIRPGISERHIQIELEAEMFRQGADAVGYGTIVGVGSHAAVLHFEPGKRTVNPDELVLIDAGGAISGYTADVTRTYPAEDRFTPRQQAIYDVVLAAESEGISKCCVGTEWHDVHRAAASRPCTRFARYRNPQRRCRRSSRFGSDCPILSTRHRSHDGTRGARCWRTFPGTRRNSAVLRCARENKFCTGRKLPDDGGARNLFCPRNP